MDILRKELNRIYESQNLESETLDSRYVAEVRNIADVLAAASGGCTVVTDASCDKCYIFAKGLAVLIGLSDHPDICREENSSDEDEVYARIHPEDLVEKRMLEYEFFKKVDSLAPIEKKDYKATCRLRMKNSHGEYVSVENSTQVIRLSPAGKIWLILCCYALSPTVAAGNGISPHIINTVTGEIFPLSFEDRRRRVLTEREKEILRLIQQGHPSKIIADILGISLHTVNRHRQNIIEKLSVGNSIEAIAAALSMKLL